MALNAKWHAAHVMPRNASDRVRLRWHVEHQKHCGCRPIPAGLARLSGGRAGTEPRRKGAAKGAVNGARRVTRNAAKAASHATRGAAKVSARPTGNAPKTAARGARNAAPSTSHATRGARADKLRRASKLPPARRSHPAPHRPASYRPAVALKAGKLVARPPGTAIWRRCGWAEGVDELYAQYHDEEWGRPSHDDRHLFEMLILEGAQAGLSWITILRKRENYRRAFDGFDPRKMAAYDGRRIQKLMRDAGIVRNRLKIEAAVANAKAFLATQKEFGSFARFLWDFVGGKPAVNRPGTRGEVPARTEISDAMSKALKKRGFRFVGSTICYAFMQATGMVNDHVAGCFLAAR